MPQLSQAGQIGIENATLSLDIRSIPDAGGLGQRATPLVGAHSHQFKHARAVELKFFRSKICNHYWYI